MPNTDSYLLLGLAVTATILGGYALSLLLRARQTLLTAVTLDSLREDDRA